MADRNTQEQTETEITHQTFSEFLENSPPTQSAHISDLAVHQHIANPYPTTRWTINTPVLELHCSDNSCDGVRFFRCTAVSDEGKRLEQGTVKNFYVTYQCSNCNKTVKVYSLAAKTNSILEPHGTCYKFGEFPPYGPPVPSRLIKLIGPDRDMFLKGRKCENQGFGIGAFTYYRRVVENQKNRILAEIIKVSKKIGAPQDKIDTLSDAIEETQFSTALNMVKDAMPESLLIDGHSPMRLLHHALSRGVHELSDEECLELASTVRLVLGELSERLSALLKDKAELTKAISTLMPR